MFEPVVIIQFLLAVVSIAGFIYKFIDDRQKHSQSSLEGIKGIIERRKKIEKEKRYIKDLEVSAVPYLRGFKWEEINVILDKDIEISTLLNLRALAKRDLLAVSENRVYIPNRSYLFKSYLKSPVAVISVSVFLYLVGIFIFSILKQSIGIIEYVVYLALLLVFEFFIIFQFDAVLSYNEIEKTEDLSDNKILISQDFGKDLELYKKSIKNLRQIERRNRS